MNRSEQKKADVKRAEAIVLAWVEKQTPLGDLIYAIADGFEAMRGAALPSGVNAACPLHGTGLRIGPARVDLGNGIVWVVEARCTCEVPPALEAP